MTEITPDVLCTFTCGCPEADKGVHLPERHPSSKRLSQTDEQPFALTESETARLKTFPEALDALADWYDYDSTCAEAVGEIECSEFDDRRAAELRAQAARLREGYES